MAKSPAPLRDPFEVVGKIPKGKSYQWVAVAVMGDSDFVQHVRVEGWKPVPAKRHPKMPKNRKGQIVYGGQILVERREEATRQARQAEFEAAQALVKSADPKSFSGHLHGSVWKLVEPVASPYDLSEIQKEIEDAGGSVPVTIRMRLTSREIDAASTCALTAHEYVRRKTMMMEEIGLSALIHRGAGEFEFGELILKKESP